jgi:hypothetical protein
MNRSLVAVLVAGTCGFVWGENRALGQVGLRPGISTPFQGPVVSPYINLLRNNPGFTGVAGQTAVNLYGIARPDIGFYGAIGGLQQQVDVNQQLITTGLGGTAGIPVTGHPVGFLNNRSYFLTFSGYGGAGGFGRGGLGGGYGGQGIGSGGFAGGGAGFGFGNTGLRPGFAPGAGAAGGAGGAGAPGTPRR